MSVVLPGVYRYHHAWTVTEGHAGHALAPASPAAMDDGMWRRIEAYDHTISRLGLTTTAFLLLCSLANAARVWRVIRRSRNRCGDSTVDGVRQSLLPALALALLYLVVVMPHPVLAPRSGARVVMVQR